MSNTPITDAFQAQFSLDEPQAYQAFNFARQLERELNEALKWKEEDPRMLREQIRVADVAFNGLHARHKALEQELNQCLKVADDLAEVVSNEMLEEFGYRRPCPQLDAYNKLKGTT